MKLMLIKITLYLFAVSIPTVILTGVWIFVFYPTLAIPEGRVLAFLVFILVGMAASSAFKEPIFEFIDREYGDVQ